MQLEPRNLRVMKFIIKNLIVSIVPTLFVGLSPDCFGRCQPHPAVLVGLVFIGVNILFFVFYLLMVGVLRLREDLS